MEETLRSHQSEQPTDTAAVVNSTVINNGSNIEMVTLTSVKTSVEEYELEEQEFSDTDTLVQEQPVETTRQSSINSRTGYLKNKLIHVDYLRPFKTFYRVQKEQMIQCCFCFVRNPC